jgi:CheY-specific phosphatase CheX
MDNSVTNRETTAALRELATVIATGGGAAVLRASAPAFLDVAFPTIAAGERERISLLLGWAMQVQHATTAVELERARRRRAAEAFAQEVGFENGK